jgi:hypothetical protein
MRFGGLDTHQLSEAYPSFWRLLIDRDGARFILNPEPLSDCVYVGYYALQAHGPDWQFLQVSDVIVLRFP